MGNDRIVIRLTTRRLLMALWLVVFLGLVAARYLNPPTILVGPCQSDAVSPLDRICSEQPIPYQPLDLVLGPAFAATVVVALVAIVVWAVRHIRFRFDLAPEQPESLAPTRGAMAWRRHQSPKLRG
jgi:hypothetical protein